MTSHLKYKNYEAYTGYSEEDQVFHGKLSNTDDLVTFEAATESGLKKAFRDAVDDYIEICTKINKSLIEVR